MNPLHFHYSFLAALGIIFILFFILIVALIVFGVIQSAKRREALAAWAAANGWSFERAKDHSFDERFEAFSALKQGNNRYADNIIRGTVGSLSFVAFDYHYETHSRDSKGGSKNHHHGFSAVLLQPPHPLKSLTIRPENLFDKIGSFFGANDIDFESGEFSRRYCVKADDRKWAYDVLHARAIEFLLARQQHHVEFSEARVFVTRNHIFNVADYKQAIAIGRRLVEELPGYVKQELQSR